MPASAYRGWRSREMPDVNLLRTDLNGSTALTRTSGDFAAVLLAVLLGEILMKITSWVGQPVLRLRDGHMELLHSRSSADEHPPGHRSFHDGTKDGALGALSQNFSEPFLPITFADAAR